MKQKTILIVILILIVFNGGIAAAQELDFKQVLKQIDESRNFEDIDISGTMIMVKEDPAEGTSIKSVTQFRRDSEDKFLMIFTEPAVQKGQGYLRVDDNLWFYDPESRKFNHSSIKEKFGDTDANNSDFGRSSYADDYTVTNSQDGTIGKYDVYILELEAAGDQVTYPFLRMWIKKDNYLLLKIENYSLTKRLIRTELFPSYSIIADHYIPSRIIYIDELTEGKQTQITVKNVSAERLPDYVFTKAYLERVNR